MQKKGGAPLLWGSVMSIEMSLVIGEGRSLQNAKERAGFEAEVAGGGLALRLLSAAAVDLPFWFCIFSGPLPGIAHRKSTCIAKRWPYFVLRQSTGVVVFLIVDPALAASRCTTMGPEPCLRQSRTAAAKAARSASSAAACRERASSNVSFEYRSPPCASTTAAIASCSLSLVPAPAAAAAAVVVVARSGDAPEAEDTRW